MSFAVVICKRSAPPQRGPANLDSLLQQPSILFFRRIDKKECLSAFSCYFFSSLSGYLSIPSIFLLYFLFHLLTFSPPLEQVPERALPDLGLHTLLAAAPPLSSLIAHTRRLNSSKTVLSGIYKQPSLSIRLGYRDPKSSPHILPSVGFT